MKEIIRILPDRKEKCLLIKAAFSKRFCENLIEERKKDFRQAQTHYPTSYRNNERQIKDDADFAEQLFREIKNYIPEKIRIEGISQNEAGEWQLDHLNSRIRICRYLADQYFNKHLDGVHYESEDQQSKLTFMIYLNGQEDFEGGRTLFFNSREDDRIIGSYTAQTGDLIIFDHNLWHSGERVSKGEKYILRSDIVYKRMGRSVGHPKMFCDEGHLGYIWSVTEFGKHFMTGGRDKKIKIWSMEGEKISEFEGHENSIVCLLHQNDHTLISASRDESIKIWQQGRDGFYLHEKLEIHKGAVLSLCKINEEEFLTAGADGRINWIHLSLGLKGHFKAHDEWIWKVERLDDEIFMTVGEDGLLKLWRMDNIRLAAVWQGEIPINTVAVDKGNGNIYLGRMDGSILELEYDAGRKELRLIRETQCHNGIVRCIKIDDRFLYSGSEDHKVRVWERATMAKREEFLHDNFVQDILLVGGAVVSVSYDGTVRRHLFLGL